MRVPFDDALRRGAKRRAPSPPVQLWQALAVAALLHALAISLLFQSGAAFRAHDDAGAALPRALDTRAPARPRPLRVEFVDLPDEPEVDNPQARIASDRGRRARSEPRPAAPAADNPEPYALGNTEQKVELPPMPGPVPPAATGEARGADRGGEEAAAGAGEGGSAGETAAARAPNGAGGAGPDGGGGGGAAAGGGGSLLRAVPRVSAGDLIESFHNPGGSAASDLGSVSFDTAVSDLSGFQTAMLRAIRRAWYERLPPAARTGVHGVVVVSFRVARDGSVSEVELVDSYGVRLGSAGKVEITPGIRPFETSAQGAVEGAEMPPLPEYFVPPDLGVAITFLYNLAPPR